MSLRAIASMVLLALPTTAMAEDAEPALAEGCTAPCAGYEVSAELQNDWVFAADPSFLRSDALEPTLTVDLFFAPTDYLQFVTSIITEPAVEPEPGENTTLKGSGPIWPNSTPPSKQARRP